MADTLRPQQLSHELGTPLNAILGGVELMLAGSAGPLTNEAYDCLAEIQSAGQDLSRHSKLLLLLVQALNTETLDETPVPLRQLFLDTLNDGQPAAIAKRLLLTGPSSDIWIVGDAFWLQALARCIVDVYLTGRDQGPLRISVRPPTCVRIDWPNFDRTAVPATALGLMGTVAHMHDARFDASTDDALEFFWPTARLQQRD